MRKLTRLATLSRFCIPTTFFLNELWTIFLTVPLHILSNFQMLQTASNLHIACMKHLFFGFSELQIRELGLFVKTAKNFLQ